MFLGAHFLLEAVLLPFSPGCRVVALPRLTHGKQEGLNCVKWVAVSRVGPESQQK